MIYEYILDNNAYYQEDHSEMSIFSTEKISATEFENIVKDAFQLCEIGYHTNVARKILEIDDRFFLPETQSIAYIGTEKNDYDDKIRGFSHK